VQDWQVQPGQPEEVHGLVESIISWARNTLAGCRRPYGIDHFDLTLAFRAPGDKRMRSLAFDRLRPIDLYQDWLPERLLSTIRQEVEAGRARPLAVSAALFSWGEAAHQALPNRAASP
jgi:hypothetical protein